MTKYTIHVTYAGARETRWGYLVHHWWAADSDTAHVRLTLTAPHGWPSWDLSGQVALLPLTQNGLELTEVVIRRVPDAE